MGVSGSTAVCERGVVGVDGPDVGVESNALRNRFVVGVLNGDDSDIEAGVPDRDRDEEEEGVTGKGLFIGVIGPVNRWSSRPVRSLRGDDKRDFVKGDEGFKGAIGVRAGRAENGMSFVAFKSGDLLSPG